MPVDGCEQADSAERWEILRVSNSSSEPFAVVAAGLDRDRAQHDMKTLNDKGFEVYMMRRCD